jgi:hypothetical protein
MAVALVSSATEQETIFCQRRSIDRGFHHRQLAGWGEGGSLVHD